MGVSPLHEDLSRVQIHETSVEAMQFAYEAKSIPDDGRGISDFGGASRLESDPQLEVRALLQAADEEVQKLIERAVERDVELKKRYQAALILSNRSAN